MVTHFNQYGANAGGPVVIPKVFDGRNKLFWLFAWEGLKDSQPSTDYATVPTQAERNGDFSALLPLGCSGGYQNNDPAVCADGKPNSYQLYNPYSAVLNGTTIVRQPIPDNKFANAGIALNPVAQAFLKFYPQPNTAGQSDGYQNYLNNAPSVDNYDNELARMDYNMSYRSHMFGDFRRNYRSQEKNNFFNNPSTGELLSRKNYGATLDEVYTFNPTTILDIRGNWTYMDQIEGGLSDGFDSTQLGLPAYINQGSLLKQVPFIGFSGGCGGQSSYQCLGSSSSTNVASQSYQIFGDVMKLIGKHSLKMGVDARKYLLDAVSYGYSSGEFTSGPNWVTQSSSSAAPKFGGDLASFLMGLPTGGQYDQNARNTLHSYYLAGFVQDDWTVSKNLVLNMGLRFDHDSPYVEKLGRTVNGFDTTEQSPIAGPAEAAYNAHPIAEIPAGAFQVRGGLTYPSNGALYQLSSHWFSPRFGFAWTPAMYDNKTVVRGGFGMFVSQISLESQASNANFSSNPIINAEGFSSTTPYVATTNNYLTPASTLSNPFPNGFVAPTGSSLGLGTFLGQNVSFLDPHPVDPYSLRWNLGVQQTLAPNLMLEIDYIGNHVVHAPVAVNELNYVPAQYQSTAPVRDQAVINTLTASTANPFQGLIPGTSLNGSKTSVAQLLSRFPQFPSGSGVTEQNQTIGQAYFNALDARVEKRLSQGLWLVATYSFSKLIEQDSFLNYTDPKPVREISPYDFTNHFVTAATYDLPFGRGRRFSISSKLADVFAGGWVVNAIYTYQTGAPIFWSSDMVTTGVPIIVNPNQTTPGGSAISKNAFNLVTADQFEYHIRKFPLTISNLRQDGINNLDSSLMKEFYFPKGTYFQLRFETFNTLNHPEFAAPNVTPTSSAFGVITKQANTPRQVQIGGRFVF